MTDAETAIWNAIRTSNAAWKEGRPRDTEALFHRNVVMAAPDGKPLARGRAEMVESYVSYCANVVTHDFEETDHSVDVFGDTAVVEYGFRVSYEANSETKTEEGRELLVFAREGDTWKVVWRMQLQGAREGA